MLQEDFDGEERLDIQWEFVLLEGGREGGRKGGRDGELGLVIKALSTFVCEVHTLFAYM